MTEKRRVDSPGEATLAREIEALLSVDPSPEFLDRIRARVAKEPPRQQPWHRWRMIAAAGAVAAVLVLVAWHWTTREIAPSVAAVEVPAKTAGATVPALAPPESPVTHAVPKPAEPEEIMTGFFPLMENPPPSERGLLVRMTVPASTMRAVGLPVGDEHLSDPVQADLLVGQDDLPRAIRFVSYRKSRD